MLRTVSSFFFALALAAGETIHIYGTVVDPSGAALAGVRVNCGDHNVYSNLDGNFSVSDEKSCHAVFEKTGFVAQNVELAMGQSARVTLALQGPTEHVVVSATRNQVTPEEAGVAANVFDARQFEIRDMPMVLDVLREVPGVQISQYGPPGTLASIFTRGSDYTNTLVLLDGVPLNDPGGEVNMAHIASSDIDRMEVVRGPQSALFGAEASAGVIQLFTKRGNAESDVPHGSVTYERGSFGTDRWIADLNGGGLGSRLDYALSTEQLHTDGEYVNTFYRDTTGSANVGYRLSHSTELRGIFRVYDAALGSPNQIAYGIVDPYANEKTRDTSLSVSADDSRGAHFSQRIAFDYHHLHDQFNDADALANDTVDVAALVRVVPGPLSRVYLVQVLTPPFPTEAPPGTELVESTGYPYSTSSLSVTDRKIADYQGTWSQASNTVVFGYNYQDQSGVISGLRVSRERQGLFADDEYKIGSRIFLTGGLRYEHSSAFGDIGTGRAAATFLLSGEHGPLSSTYFRLSAGRGVTEPSLYENYVQESFAVGNPALRPETTMSYEAGLVQTWWGQRIRTEVAAFRNSFRDLITYIYPTWENIGASWGRGVETSVEARLPHGIRVNAAYTLLYTRITDSTSPESTSTGIGYELVHRAKNSGSVSLAWAPKRWSFMAGARIVGERQDADYVFGVNRDPGYENVFASATYQLSKHVEPVFRIDNLLNEHYQDVVGYPALTRSAMGGVRLSW